jgi:hypothetical protein
MAMLLHTLGSIYPVAEQGRYVQLKEMLAVVNIPGSKSLQKRHAGAIIRPAALPGR